MATPKLVLFLGALLGVLSLAAAQAPPPAAAAGNGSNCDPLNLGVCASVLDGLINVTAGRLGGRLIPGDDGQCCTLIGGLVDLNVAACLCTAVRVRANVLRIIRIDVAPLIVRLLLDRCGQTAPANFTCPPA